MPARCNGIFLVDHRRHYEQSQSLGVGQKSSVSPLFFKPRKMEYFPKELYLPFFRYIAVVDPTHWNRDRLECLVWRLTLVKCVIYDASKGPSTVCLPVRLSGNYLRVKQPDPTVTTPRKMRNCTPSWYLGESTWDHPCDEYYRKLYEEEKKKKMTKDKAKHDKSKQQVKAFVRYSVVW